jgi:hypothetical protein
MTSPTFINQVADKISQLGLTTPAILLLEAHKPLAFIGSQFLLVVQPTLGLVLPSHLLRNTSDLLADPNQYERLIAILEQKEALPKGRKNL